MIRATLKWVGTGLLFAVVSFCFAPTLVPPFLDRVYYQGPVSDHFDGAHFFNPDRPSPGRVDPRRFLNRWANGERAAWPDSVPVHPTVPPARVAGRDMLVTWIGHSTVLVQTEGLNILTDPIWSERASPFSFIGPRRVRAPGVRFEDLPRIDLVLVSHNHYDHMDLPTLRRLWERDRPLIVTSLGNDTILRGVGIEAVARDWGESVAVRPGIDVLIERNHHWGSRWGTDRNRALWSAFTIRTPAGNIFFAGDTGWGGGGWARGGASRPVPARHLADRRLSAARRDAGQPCRSRRIGAHLRGAEPGPRARRALGHVPAHLRRDRRSAARARRAAARTRHRPGPLRRDRGRADVQGAGTMSFSASGRMR